MHALLLECRTNWSWPDDAIAILEKKHCEADSERLPLKNTTGAPKKLEISVTLGRLSLAFLSHYGASSVATFYNADVRLIVVRCESSHGQYLMQSFHAQSKHNGIIPTAQTPFNFRARLATRTEQWHEPYEVKLLLISLQAADSRYEIS